MANEEKVATKTPTKKGNKTTEIIIGAGASKLSTAVAQLKAVIEIVNQLPEKAQESVLLVTDLEDKIGSLKQDFANKVAQNKIELNQQFEADKKALVNKYLSENNLEAVDAHELINMQTKISDAEDTLEKTVRAEVGKAVGMEKNNTTQTLKIQQLEHEKTQAANNAEIAHLKIQNKFLEDQINSFKLMIEAQQKAETERAKYSQISTLNVGGTTQGR